MHADSFAATVPVAREQCLRAQLSEAECDEFAERLAAGEYEEVMVPDGTRYGAMNFARDGVPHLAGATVKRLGADTPAWRVHLSSGRVLDWYTGFAGACNNVGLDPRAPAPPPQEPPGEDEWVPFSDPVGGGTYQRYPGYIQQTCPCGGVDFVPGYDFTMPSTLESQGGYWRSQ